MQTCLDWGSSDKEIGGTAETRSGLPMEKGDEAER